MAKKPEDVSDTIIFKNEKPGPSAPPLPSLTKKDEKIINDLLTRPKIAPKGKEPPEGGPK